MVAHEGGEAFQEILGALGGAVATGHLDQPVGMVRDGQPVGPGGVRAVQDGAEAGPRLKPGGERGGRFLPQSIERRFWRLSGCPRVGLARRIEEAGEPLAEADQQLIANERAMRIVIDSDELIEQLGQGDRRVHHHGPHIREALQVGIDIDGIEDAECLLADLIAAPRPPRD